MFRSFNFIVVFVSFSAMLALSGCSSDGKYISGTAHEGKMIASKAVKIYDSTGRVVSEHTDSVGHYDINVEGLTEPFLLVITGDNGLLVSFARTAGQININPITTEVVALAANTADIQGMISSHPKELFDSIDHYFDVEKNLVSASLRTVLPAGASTENFFIDPITQGVGLDLFFDEHLLTIDATNGILLKTRTATPKTLLHISADRVVEFRNAVLPVAGALLTATSPPSQIPTDIVAAAKGQAPLLWLTKDQTYSPCSVDYYLANMDIAGEYCPVALDSNGHCPQGTVKDYTTKLNNYITLTKKNLTTLPLDNKYNYRRYLWPKVLDTKVDRFIATDNSGFYLKHYPWDTYALTRGDNKRIPYISALKIQVADQYWNQRQYLVVKYNTFYSFNTLSTTYDNLHFGDWEAVSMIFAWENGSWQQGALITQTHGKDPALKHWKDTEHSSDGQVYAYAAKNGHGTHNNATSCLSDGGDLCAKEDQWDMRNSDGFEFIEYSELRFPAPNDFSNFVTNIDNGTLNTIDQVNKYSNFI